MIRMRKKGQITILFVFFIAFIVIALIFGVMAPIGADINTKFYEAGEDILEDAIVTLEDIDDPEVRAALNATLQSAKAQGQSNIEINANMFKYSWAFMIGILGLILFIFTRRSVEVGGMV